MGGLSRLALRPRDGPRHGPADRVRRAPPHLLRRRRRPGRGAGGPAAPPGGPRRVRRPHRPPHPQQLPPPRAQLLHAAAARGVDRRRSPRPVDEPGHRRLARRARRGVRRGGGRALAVRPRRVRRGQLRAARVGRRHGQLRRPRARPRRPPPAADRHRPAATRRRARGQPRLRERPGPFLDRPRARRARVPGDTLVALPADDRFRLHAAPVAEAVARDRAAGLRPIAIAAVAGSTNTGSVDLVPELADLAQREGLWLHVDAAYGGAARLSARDRDASPASTSRTA